MNEPTLGGARRRRPVLSLEKTGSALGAWVFLGAPSPTPTPTVLRAPPASPLEAVGAAIAIVLALAAGILGYRIIRGGRGL